MPDTAQPGSARRCELLDLAYRYVLANGATDLALRPLAEAIGSSAGVLLYLFGSKDALVQALIERARADELALLERAGSAEGIWEWIAAPEHRNLLRLWVEGYTRSLVEPDGPWAGYGERSVRYWLDVLADGAGSITDATAVLAVLRGAMLDLLATGDVERTTEAVHRQLRAGRGGGI